MDTTTLYQYCWETHTPRTLASGSPGTPANPQEEYAKAVWEYATRTAESATNPLADGLLAGYKLEEASGPRADVLGGTSLTDNNTVGQAAGKLGYAADFIAANNEYLSVASAAAFQFGAGVSKTIAFWHYDPTGPVAGATAIVAKDGATMREWAVTFANKQLSIITFDAAGTPTVLTQSTPVQYTSGQWNLVVCGYNAATGKTFLRLNNGTLHQSAAHGDVRAGTQEVTLGRSTYYGGTAQNHRVDSVYLWNRVLTVEEETTLWNNGAGLDYPFPILGTAAIRGQRSRITGSGSVAVAGVAALAGQRSTITADASARSYYPGRAGRQISRAGATASQVSRSRATAKQIRRVGQ